MPARLLLLTVVASFLSLRSAAAQRSTPPGAPGAPVARGAADSIQTGRDSTGVPAIDRVSTTKHTVTIDGKTIPYTSRAGTMIIRDDAGKPKGSVFYISYTRDQQNSTTPPITFFFNGGPGSAS